MKIKFTFGYVQIYFYSPFHVVQKTDLLEFLHEYCQEKSETFTDFFTYFVFKTRN